MRNRTFLGADVANSTISESERLWPDPFEAPEVPPREYLETWLKTEDAARDPEISEQIRESIACQRAIQAIRDDQLLGISLKEAASAAMERTRMVPVSDAASKTAPPIPRGDSPLAAMAGSDLQRVPGQIVRCCGVLRILSGGIICKRLLREPPLVMLVERAHHAKAASTWSTLLCSSASSWSGFIGEDDVAISIPVLGDLIVHLWTETTLAEAQLGAPVSTAGAVSLEAICEAQCALLEHQNAGLADECETRPERKRVQIYQQWLHAGFRGECGAGNHPNPREIA